MNATFKTLLLLAAFLAFSPVEGKAQVQIEKDPDLVIESIVVKYRRTQNRTEVLKVKVTAENRGSKKSDPSFMDLYMSTDDQLSTQGQDIKFAQERVKSMKPGQERVTVINRNSLAGLPVRNMYIIGIADSREQNLEENEHNNLTVSRQIP